MVDFDKKADMLSDRLNAYIDQERTKGRPVTAEAARVTAEDFHRLQLDFDTAAKNAKEALDSAMRNYQIVTGRLTAEYYRLKNLEATAGTTGSTLFTKTFSPEDYWKKR